MLDNCKPIIISLVTEIKFLDLVEKCQAIDPMADPMKVSQVISDLVAEKSICPVFYHSVLKAYRELPIHIQKQLFEADPKDFRNLYSKLKKRTSAKVAYHHEKLHLLSKNGLAAPAEPPVTNQEKTKLSIKERVLRSLFGPKTK